MAGDAAVNSYYRYFEAPGVGHCYTPSGLYPAGIFDAMRKWVEQGVAPETLEVDASSLFGPPRGRILCPHPKKSRYDRKGPVESISSYYCA
jgi:hypothetical protein